MTKKKSYDFYINDLKKENRKPTRQEFSLLGIMILSEKKYQIKEWFKRVLHIE